MNSFLKLNFISIFFALFAFIWSVIALGSTFFQNKIGLSHTLIVEVIMFTLFILGIFLIHKIFLKIGKEYIKNGYSYWSTIMWFPYWLLFHLTFTSFFPIGDDDNYGVGFIILCFIMIYPLFIGYTLWIIKNRDKKFN
jgi:hypothetical protein